MSTDCRYCGKPPDEEEGDDWVGECPDCDQLRQDLMVQFPNMKSRGLITARLLIVLRNRAVIEDLEWLVEAGETNCSVLAKRVEYPTVEAMQRLLHREGRHDLAARIAWTHLGESRKVGAEVMIAAARYEMNHHHAAP